MTPEEHNKFLGWAHIIHGGLYLLMILAILTMMTFVFLFAPPGPNDPPPMALIPILWIFFGVFFGLMLTPSLIAGYALLKRKRWAKIAAIIGGVTAANSFPIGTAVCVYTFWFLFSEPGKQMYDRGSLALPPQSANWQSTANQSQREPQYAPPPTPPDWR